MTIADNSIFYIITAAYILDMLLGDPLWLPHPVVWMGKAISYFEAPFRRLFKQSELFAGLLFALFLISLAWISAYIVIKISCMIHAYAAIAVQTVLMFFCLSARTLQKAALEVEHAFTSGVAQSINRNNFDNNGLESARLKVSMIVGRDVKHLNETGVVKATIETVAENFVDGFISPLLFAIVGGIPAAVAYKMINTLDSMVGYRNEKYILFGRASARIDDIANFIPARISVIIISTAAALISSRSGKLAFKTAVIEGKEHKSPNSGYPEAAFAGALEVKLGGPNYYNTILVEKPYIGKKFKNPKREQIKKACDLMMLSSFISIILFMPIFIFI